MNLVEHSVTEYNTDDGYLPLFPSDEALILLEKAGRTCYKSEKEDITASSAKAFCYRMFKSGHMSVIEHSNLVFVASFKFPSTDIDYTFFVKDEQIVNVLNLFNSPFIKIDSSFVYSSDNKSIVMLGHFQSNLRGWIEKFIYDTDEFENFEQIYNTIIERVTMVLSKVFTNVTVEKKNKDIPYSMRRKAFRIVTNRSNLAELTRHRKDIAFSVESQRYVDAKEGVTFIQPYWFPKDDEEQTEDMKTAVIATKEAFLASENFYKALRDCGRSKQESRVVLNNGAATVIFVTANTKEWKHIFNLRCSSAADPEMQKMMGMVKTECDKNKDEYGYEI